MTTGSSIQAPVQEVRYAVGAGSAGAVTFTALPHSGQVSMPILKTRFSRCAQDIAMDGMYAGFCYPGVGTDASIIFYTAAQVL